jgi:hypothetical protein
MQGLSIRLIDSTQIGVIDVLPDGSMKTRDNENPRHYFRAWPLGRESA